MTFQEFKTSLSASQPQAELPDLLKALWFDANGDWEKAHNIAQETNGAEYCLIHAYLHRKEGDIWNADYWYRRAKRNRPEITLDDEWEQLVKEMLV
jgi:hypothetical protein